MLCILRVRLAVPPCSLFRAKASKCGIIVCGFRNYYSQPLEIARYVWLSNCRGPLVRSGVRSCSVALRVIWLMRPKPWCEKDSPQSFGGQEPTCPDPFYVFTPDDDSCRNLYYVSYLCRHAPCLHLQARLFVLFHMSRMPPVPDTAGWDATSFMNRLLCRKTSIRQLQQEGTLARVLFQWQPLPRLKGEISSAALTLKGGPDRGGATFDIIRCYC